MAVSTTGSVGSGSIAVEPVAVVRPPRAVVRAVAARRWLPARLTAAVLAGAALLASAQWTPAWWLAPAGVAALALACHRCSPRMGALLGLLTGLSLFLPLVSWTNLHTGTLPWLLLAASQAAFVALLGAASAAGSGLLRRAWAWGPLTGAWWTAQEALRDRIPFGGFPWGRLAYTQGDGPLQRFAALGGAPLVTFAVAATGGLLAAAAFAVRPGRQPSGGLRRDGWRHAGAWVALAVAVMAAAWLVPTTAPSGRAYTIAIVQGNVPRLGLDFNAQRRAVLDNHVNGTLRLADQVDRGERPRPDLVVWPENSSDIDPLRNADASERIEAAAQAIDAPILLGALLDATDDDHVLNAGLLWRPGAGETERYVKRHPVPFAEYMPLRSIARLVSDKVDTLRREFKAGDRVGLLPVGDASIGDVICFEVAYDGLVRDVVTAGAQLIVVQTNNATFNEAEAAQQLAMVRLRAVEHGRPALMASTVGISAVVDADGRIRRRTGFNVDAVLVEQVRLGASQHTLATTLGAWPEYLLIGVAAGALLLAARTARTRKPGRTPATERPGEPTAALTAATQPGGPTAASTTTSAEATTSAPASTVSTAPTSTPASTVTGS